MEGGKPHSAASVPAAVVALPPRSLVSLAPRAGIVNSIILARFARPICNRWYNKRAAVRAEDGQTALVLQRRRATLAAGDI